MKKRALILALGIVAALGVTACSKTSCQGGNACAGQTNDVCESIAGCKLQPACLLRSLAETIQKTCSTATREADCVDSKCTWTGTACVDRCGTVQDKDACSNLRSPEQDLYGRFLWECRWAECTGTPEKDCHDFSAEMCPQGLGCVVTTICTFGDCGD
jgi:hypothetical protein